MQRGRTIRSLVAILLATNIILTEKATPAMAATHGCYGASCNGLDPTGRCDGDARTVAATDVQDGMLELRWSPSCTANWGRYTNYRRTAIMLAAQGWYIWPHIEAYLPDGSMRVGPVNHNIGPGESSWSTMVDGRGPACTRVHIKHVTLQHDHEESFGWQWGPCV